MAIKTGIAGQVGLKKETTYGTAVTVDRFFYAASFSVTPVLRKRRVRARGAGIVDRTNMSQTVLIGYKGKMVLPVMDKSFGIFHQAVLGANTTAQVGGTTEYTHTGIIDLTTAMQGVSYTVQAGVPGTDGTVRAFTGEGGKVESWELTADDGGEVMLTLNWDFETGTTATALASASYPSGWTPYVSEDCAWTVGGSAVFVRKWTIKGGPTWDVDRRGMSTVLKKEPLWVGPYNIDIELDCEFEDLTHTASLLAGTQQAAVCTITGDTIPTESNPFKNVITFAKVDFEQNDAPVVDGDGIVRQGLKAHVLYDGSTAPISWVIHNNDSTA